MPSNINPTLEPTKSLDKFRFWCQKVLPLVYDDSLSYYEVLGKMVVQLNDVIDNVNADTDNVLTLKDAFLELQTYVNNFFDDIDQLASYAERAEAAQTAANTSAVNAASSASNASASSLAAMDARDAAVTAKQAAQTSANTASEAATNANTKANEAAQSAITAQTAQASASQSATLAATDRSAAQTAATTATTKANEASESAENAAQSKTDAEELVNTVQESIEDIQRNTRAIAELNNTLVLMGKNGEFWGLFENKDPTSSPNSPIRYNDSTIRISIPTIITASEEITVKANTNYQFSVLTVDENNIYAGSTGWKTQYTIPSGTKFTLVIRKNNNGNITREEATNITFNNDIQSNSNYNTANLIQAITAIAPILMDYIADTNLQINDFRFVKNTLYRITSPITVGTTLVPNTNCTKTTVGAVLKSLLS